jgi:predicted transcriptional regulator
MNTGDASIRALPLKEQLRAILDQMPNDCTIDDLQYELHILGRIRRGLDSIDRGEGIPHEEVRQRMQKWLTK